jgi:hypothetical protein
MDCISLYFIKTVTSVNLINVLIIVHIMSNFYPYIVDVNYVKSIHHIGTDGLQIINLFFPYWKGLPDPFYVTLITITSYVIYWFLTL